MNLGASTALQARSIFALMMRRIRTRYKESRAGYVWAIIEPIVWVFVIKLAIRSHAHTPPVGDSFEIFVASGIVIARTWRSAVQQVLPYITRDRKRFLPTLHRLDAAYAAWALEIATGGVALVIVFCILGMFGFSAQPGNLLMCVIVFLAMGVYSLAFALTFSIVLVIAPGLHHFKTIILMALFITSGFSFAVDRMDPNFREFLVWNPLLHCVEWFREAFFYGYECRSLDLVYLFSVTILGLTIGLAAERALRRKRNADTGEEQEEDVF